MSNREPSVSLEDYDISFLRGDAFSQTLQPPSTAEDKSLLIPLHELLNAGDCEPHRLRNKGCSEAKRKGSRRPTHQSIAGGYPTAFESPDAVVTSKPALPPGTMTTFLDDRKGAVPRDSLVTSHRCRRSLRPSVNEDSASISLPTQFYSAPGIPLLPSSRGASLQRATHSVVATKPLRKISVRQSNAVTDALDLMYGHKDTQKRCQRAFEIQDD